MRRLYGLFLVTILLWGCGGPATDERRAQPKPISDSQLLEPLVLSSKPEGARSISEVREQAKDGEEVVLHGQVPPEKIKPFSDTFAAFTLMAPEDLASERVKEEFDCDDAAT